MNSDQRIGPADAEVVMFNKGGRDFRIERLQQGQETPRATATFILITHDTVETSIRAAISQIEKDGHVASKPRLIRIERL